MRSATSRSLSREERTFSAVGLGRTSPPKKVRNSLRRRKISSIRVTRACTSSARMSRRPMRDAASVLFTLELISQKVGISSASSAVQRRMFSGSWTLIRACAARPAMRSTENSAAQRQSPTISPWMSSIPELVALDGCRASLGSALNSSINLSSVSVVMLDSSAEVLLDLEDLEGLGVSALPGPVPMTSLRRSWNRARRLPECVE
mmetsp:Transcript_19254/g.54028  ORF Transcript_19254/g.54028 Transcript_19254/m.54028 type:complete len:205 (-) Transcript_19254:1137-1751(-)